MAEALKEQDHAIGEEQHQADRAQCLESQEAAGLGVVFFIWPWVKIPIIPQ